jgi:hypothetical protein
MSGNREDEQTKLTANWLNTVSAGMITVGVVGPVAAAIVSFPSPPFDLGNLVVGVALWLATGLGLHWAARYRLRELSDDED